MGSVFERRTSRCQAELRRREADALVIGPGSNMYYLTGFDDEPSERHLLFVLPDEGNPTFIAPEMYYEQINTASWVEDIRTWDDTTGPDSIIDSTLSRHNVKEGDVLVNESLWAKFLLDLQSKLPETEFERATLVLDDLRMIKDDDELDSLSSAASASDEVSREIRSLGDEVIGMTESALVEDINRRLTEGGTGPAFATIVGSGPNGARPHHRSSDREIRSGDPVVLDFGTTVDRYPGDQTRTVVFDGEPPDEFETVHATVHAALDAGVDVVEPGITAAEVDRTVRSVIEEAGYGEWFTHRTGHGVGLDVHEAPYIVAGNNRELEPGMVFSIEPGIYFNDEFGVRIEDLVRVTENGCERLNDSPRTWKPL
ncbi:M24 family metallopeptidase [Halostella pelagica]|uniref:M24 family metallopeptidase n=1 Tax=Halostella pelagica TaxID=2583824 RepID=UPI00108017F5|nr:Xaa-Pro peptidase family protein [Halostella pelagica]